MADNLQTKTEKLIKYANEKFGTNEADLRSIIDSAEVGAGGEYDLESVLLEDGTQKIVATAAGIKIKEYKPNADMKWAKSEFEKNVAENEYAMLNMIGDVETTSEITIPPRCYVKTSDGGYYSNDSDSQTRINHTWDDTNARDTVNYKDVYKKVRWIITYGKSGMINGGVSNQIYGLYKLYMYTTTFFQENRFLEYCEFLTPFVYSGSGTGLSNMFKACTSLQSVPAMNTSNITGMSSMFNSCYSLESIPEIDTSNVTSMESMVAGCYSLRSFPALNTSKVKTMYYMFNSCYSLESIPELDTSSVTDMSGMFQNCNNLKSVPAMNTSNVTKIDSMFLNCYSLENVPEMDTSNVTNMNSMFSGCSMLKTIPEMDTSNVRSMSMLFSGCSCLRFVPEIDTSNATSLQGFFQNCSTLQYIPKIDTRKSSNMIYMFTNCYNLKTIPEIDMRSATSVSSMFNECRKLESLTLKNIKISLQIAASTYGTLLTLDSLLNTIKELWDNSTGTSTLTLTVGSVNIGKLANVYVKPIDITDEMRAEDEYIDLKKPFVVCESTDEGAMLVTEYVTSKNWQLK